MSFTLLDEVSEHVIPRKIKYFFGGPERGALLGKPISFARVKEDEFGIPIVDAGGNGSKIPAVLGCPLRLPPRAPRVQEYSY